MHQDLQTRRHWARLLGSRLANISKQIWDKPSLSTKISMLFNISQIRNAVHKRRRPGRMFWITRSRGWVGSTSHWKTSSLIQTGLIEQDYRIWLTVCCWRNSRNNGEVFAIYVQLELYYFVIVGFEERLVQAETSEDEDWRCQYLCPHKTRNLVKQ